MPDMADIDAPTFQAMRILVDGDGDGQPGRRWPRFAVKRPYTNSTYKSFVVCVEENEGVAAASPMRLALEYGVHAKDLTLAVACYAKDLLGELGPPVEGFRFVAAFQFKKEMNVPQARAKLIGMLRRANEHQVNLDEIANRAEPLLLDVAVFLRDAWLRIDMAFDAPTAAPSAEECKHVHEALLAGRGADADALRRVSHADPEMAQEMERHAEDRMAMLETFKLGPYVVGEVCPIYEESMGRPLSYKCHFSVGEGKLEAYVPLRMDKKRLLKLVRVHSMVNLEQASGTSIVKELERLEEAGHIPMADNDQTMAWRAMEVLKATRKMTAAEAREAKAEVWKTAAAKKRSPCEWCRRPIKDAFRLEEDEKDFCSRECAGAWAGRLVCEACDLEPLQMPSFEEAVQRRMTSDELFKCECGGTLWPYKFGLARQLGDRSNFVEHLIQKMQATLR